MVDEFGLGDHLRLNATVVSAEFTGAGWRLETADGSVLSADFVIAATGVLHHPFTPDIPGLETFAGDVVHTARWDDEIATDGRRIAVVGTGSTGVQVVSALAAQRGPHHALRAHPAVGDVGADGTATTRCARRVAAQAAREHSGCSTTRCCGAQAFWPTSLLDRAGASVWFSSMRVGLCASRSAIARCVTGSPRTTNRFCKRQVISGSYYRAIWCVECRTGDRGDRRITPRGIRTASGRDIDVDLLVFATGFHAHNYMRPMNLRGRDGVSIDDAWAKGPRAYRMTAIPGFPNFFTVLGPNSPTGSISLQYSAELTARYITHWLRRFRDGEVDTVEVTEEATTKFNDDAACGARPDGVEHRLQLLVSHRRRQRRPVAIRPQDHDRHADHT